MISISFNFCCWNSRIKPKERICAGTRTKQIQLCTKSSFMTPSRVVINVFLISQFLWIVQPAKPLCIYYMNVVNILYYSISRTMTTANILRYLSFLQHCVRVTKSNINVFYLLLFLNLHHSETSYFPCEYRSISASPLSTHNIFQ